VRVLVTGATGFIGGALVRRLLQEGHDVAALALPGDPLASEVERMGARMVRGDLARPETLPAAVEGRERVFHCAGIVTDWAPRPLFEEVNVQGVRNLLEACHRAGVGRFVHLSTNDVFGLEEGRVLDEECPLRPWGEPYPDTKIEAERLVWSYGRDRGLPATMAYPCWVFGPGDRTFVPLLADAILKGEMMFWRGGTLVWPCFIENLVDLLVLLSSEAGAVGRGYLAHDGESLTLEEFCARIASALGRRPPTLQIPYPVAYAGAVAMEGAWSLLGIKARPLLTTYAVRNLGSRLRFSNERARRELGWVPRVGFEEGLERTLAWLRTVDRDSFRSK